MTAYEYLNELREALKVLPEDERRNAIRYYEEYFLDAGVENEASVIEELGPPEQAAQSILEAYTEVARVAPRPEGGQAFQEEPPPEFVYGNAYKPPRSPLLTFLAVCGAVFLGVTVGLPLLAAAAATVFGLTVGAFGVLLGVAAVLACLLIVLPVVLLVAGAVLCVFSLFLWRMPPSAAVTLGVGLMLLALGGMLSVGCMKLCAAAFRPLLRACGWCMEQCGRFGRWCVDVVHRFLERLRGV